MHILKVVKSNKHQVIGTDENKIDHIIDVSLLPTRPAVGVRVEGYRAGNTMFAERFLAPRVKNRYQRGQRFALKRDFETMVDGIDEEATRGLRTYPEGAAFTIANSTSNGRWHIVFDRDKRDSRTSHLYYSMSEEIIRELVRHED